GTAALQLCKLYGARVIGTGRKQAKLDRAVKLGLERPVLVSEGHFSAKVKQLTAGRGVDLALDLVGGDWFAETVDAMAPRGTIMLVGLVAGVSAEVPLRSVLTKRLQLIGTVMRARTLEEKIVVARAFEQRLVPAFASGALKPVIDAVLPMADLRSALQRMAANDSFGKLVLTW
ncbi:MAG TPA: zinc-binding dehydrogenase, partial [Archangium sp.]